MQRLKKFLARRLKEMRNHMAYRGQDPDDELPPLDEWESYLWERGYEKACADALDELKD